jgi:fatty acid desaturase
MQATYVHEIPNPCSKWVHHTKFTSQKRECSLVQTFCEDTRKLFLGWHMYQIYVPLVHIIFQKVVSHLYMFGSGMEDVDR